MIEAPFCIEKPFPKTEDQSRLCHLADQCPVSKTKKQYFLVISDSSPRPFNLNLKVCTLKRPPCNILNSKFLLGFVLWRNVQVHLSAR